MLPKKAPSAVRSVLLVLVAAARDKEYLGKGRHTRSRLMGWISFHF